MSRRRIALALLLAAAAVLALGAGTAVASTRVALRHAGAVAFDVASETSSNWAGYAVESGDPSTGAAPTTFTSVTGSWTQPAVSCTRGGTTYSAFWVGLGGFADGSQALEQVGTGADCGVTGRPSYSVWYELVPAGPVTVRMSVKPGDAVSASVSVTGQVVSLQLTNTTQGTTFARQLTMSSPDLTSAEWIAESPSACTGFGCSPLPLANFGSVSFSGANVTGNGHAGTVSDPAWAATAVTLHATGGGSLFRSRFASAPLVADAIPATLSSDGSAFAVSWQQQAAQPNPAQPGAPGRGRGWRWGV